MPTQTTGHHQSIYDAISFDTVRIAAFPALA
jgi:hypothetical protein